VKEEPILIKVEPHESFATAADPNFGGSPPNSQSKTEPVQESEHPYLINDSVKINTGVFLEDCKKRRYSSGSDTASIGSSASVESRALQDSDIVVINDEDEEEKCTEQKQAEETDCMDRACVDVADAPVMGIVTFIQIILVLISIGIGGVAQFPGSNPALGPPRHTLVLLGARSVPEILGYCNETAHSNVDNSSELKCSQWWRLVSSLFLHSGVLHVGGVAVVQLVFGKCLEKNWGSWRVLFIYLLCGCSGNGAAVVLGSSSSIGAGACASLTGLACASLTGLIGYKWESVANGKLACMFILVVLAMEITSLLVQLGIASDAKASLGLLRLDSTAHLSGALIGILTGCVLWPSRKELQLSSAARQLKQGFMVISLPTLVVLEIYCGYRLWNMTGNAPGLLINRLWKHLS
jgi:membrane associated rhomboid family serine protease